ncbi:RecD-like DNA helicase C-terminal domain protein [Candidatus Cyrtobacter comes]|uniref:RecD-like DNA helicase C-terminal domain protein n=1 Tax=Candidatus Cyrtobacter comes TaxID=675776 RepID=A0ABU5L9H2_9RICK|nr:ATP-binding domain-containing protein [Candidatus Cyrtobacter comes]MDZ5762765.1 RecD-like DNA helicase C-terminal domain protein [Candidatus Cyrtobacter comes]
MQRGGVGARALNTELQKALNGSTEYITKYGQNYAIGDKVMQVENDYDKEIYNGDIGYIRKIDLNEQIAEIEFDGEIKEYDFTDFDKITLAYATTIHKSQGSEYPVVVIPLFMQSYLMLQKNLIYTGITRGKRLVILVVEKKALVIGSTSKKSILRYTKLKDQVQGLWVRRQLKTPYIN